MNDEHWDFNTILTRIENLNSLKLRRIKALDSDLTKHLKHREQWKLQITTRWEQRVTTDCRLKVTGC